MNEEIGKRLFVRTRLGERGMSGGSVFQSTPFGQPVALERRDQRQFHILRDGDSDRHFRPQLDGRFID